MRRKAWRWPQTYGLMNMWEKPGLRLGLLGIILVPVVYSFIYLWAFYDPYAQVDRLPVAVVNEDQGAVADGKAVRAGDDLVKELKKEKKLDWDFVSRKEMEKGFREDRYYFGVVIPRDFSRRAVSVNSAAPLKGELEFYVDEGKNFISSQIGRKAFLAMEGEIQRQLTEMYARGMLDKMKRSTQDLSKAADGAGTLADSTSQAASAGRKIHSGVKRLEQGAQRLKQGGDQLDNGAQALAQGAAQAGDGAGQLAAGAERLNSGIHQLSQGIQRGAKGAAQLNEGARQVKDGLQEASRKVNDRLLPGSAQVAEGSEKVAEGAEQAQVTYQQLLKRYPWLKADPDGIKLAVILTGMRDGGQRLSDGADQLHQGVTQLNDGLNRLTDGQDRVVQGTEQLRDGIVQQQAGAAQLVSGSSQLAGKLRELQQGMANLTSGISQWRDGLSQWIAGQKQLSGALAQLDDGTDRLSDGLTRITDGQIQLAHGLVEGTDQARNQLRGADAKAKMMADPVDIKEDRLNPVPNYATALTPYFLSLSLWVGGLILFTILDLYRSPWEKQQRISWVAGGLIGVLQAVVATTALTRGLGISPQHPVGVYAFAILMSFAFIALNQMLVLLLNNVGRFLSILLLMLQLTSSGGTYPVELLPAFFRHIHPYLPMTYSVDGLRAAVTTGDVSVLERDAWILVGFMAVALLIVELYRVWQGFRLRRTKRGEAGVTV
ncbi:phage infection protein [Polycladomyces abyssicola]|uniref:Phage infection protein n=1 Tax=Polycladomyces abyssicola TaxID=1125966 RepID=A0A8D5ZLW0_9BACL|nr:YhgE/Pip domain-containing protein [Polycladomyces abyssicola]BCU80237.1 phage infection protein [Polycladomyces abyssicola]